MSKKLRFVTLFLLLVLAASLPLLIYALPPSEYNNTMISSAFYDNDPIYTSGVSFDGYQGNWTVGSFLPDHPEDYSPFYGFSTKYNILCRTNSTEGDQWAYGGMYLSGATTHRMILVGNYATAIAYTAPRSGTVSLSFDDFRLHNASGSSTVLSANFAVFRNGEKIFPSQDGWQNYSSPAALSHNSSYIPDSIPSLSAEVQAGDVITIALHKQTNLTQYAYMNPCVTYTSYHGESFAQEDSFAPAQGGGGWYAYYGYPGRDAAYPLVYSEASASFGGVEGAGTVSAGALSVGQEKDTVLLFRSPIIATYTLSSDIFSSDADVTCSATIFRADGSSAAVFNGRTPGQFNDVTGIYLDRGDILAIRFSPITGGADILFSPVMTATETLNDTSRNGEAFTRLSGEDALRPDLRLDSTSIALSGQINLHIYAYFSDQISQNADEYGLLLFPSDAADTDYASAIKLNDAALQSDGTYRFVLSDIAAKEMSDTFLIRAYAKTGDTVLYDEAISCSVRDVAMRLHTLYKDSTTPRGQALYTLVCRLLNYGAAAQQFFEYRTDDLANRYLTQAEQSIPSSTFVSHYTHTGSATLTSAGFSAATLVLGDLPRIRLIIQISDPEALSSLSVQMASDAAFSDIFATLPLSALPLYDGALYCADTNGITPDKLETVFYFRITDGTNVSTTLAYSIESYAARMSDSDIQLSQVMHAMFAYADAVGAYASAANQPIAGTLISSADLVDLIRQNALTSGGIYTVSDVYPMTFGPVDNGAVYDGNGALIYSEGGFQIIGADSLTIKNLSVSMSNTGACALSVTHASDIILDHVDIGGSCAVGIYAGPDTNGLILKEATLDATAGISVHLHGDAQHIYLLDNTISGSQNAAIIDESGAYISGNTISAAGDGIRVFADEAELRNNTLRTTGIGILAENGKNLLLSANDVAGSDILLDACDNASLVLNTAANLQVTDGMHMYVVKNSLSSTLTLSGNEYLLADSNLYTTLSASQNTQQNGDTVTDVDARLDVGADESLLPHVDKDLFVGMERKDSVRTGSGTSQLLLSYLKDALAKDTDIFLAPGAYSVQQTLTLSELDGINIYAYGVLLERQDSLGSIISISNCDNIAFQGLTIGYAQQSCGQVYVLDKLDNNKLLVVTGAGMMNEFGNTNTAYFNTTGMGAQRAGTFYAFCDTSFLQITKRPDGLMEMEVSASVYAMLQEGDILTCRAVNGTTTVPVYNSGDISFTDMVVYGSAAGFAFVENDNHTATTYYRVADTTRNGAIISEEEYNRYLALESLYGVDLEIGTDGQGRYRGSLPHIGSIDATHTTRCAQGSIAISCLFENMCDDGTNQNHTHARLADVTDNQDGTTTITYKGNWSEYSHNNNYTSHGTCSPFEVGHRVYIYTSAGQLVCDTPALSATAAAGTGINSYTGTEYNKYTVTVATDAVNFLALQGYDLSDDNYLPDNKVLIDNMSRASNGFVFDNTVVRNIRSRGLLIKASDAQITNCTFQNIGMSAVAILYEIYWGESGVTENLEVARNLFDHTGYFSNIDRYAPVAIEGLGSRADEDFLLYKNIQITDNRILDRTTDYAIYVNSAKNVTISDNFFGPRYGMSDTNDSAALIHVYCASGIEISDNQYPSAATGVRFRLEKAVNVSGSDVSPISFSLRDSFSGSLPTHNTTDYAIQFQGNWSVGYIPVGTAPDGSNFTPYSYYCASNGWITQTQNSSSLWNGTGGIWGSNSYRYAAQSGYNVAIAYTAAQDCSALLSLSAFHAPYGDGNHTGYYAIFLNDEMIYPTAGGDYTDGSDWKTISDSSTLSGLNAELQALGPITLNADDVLYFCAKTAGSWSNFAAHPVVELCADSFVIGGNNWPTYSGDTFTGFHGRYTVGYLGANGGTYTPYGKMYSDATIPLLHATSDTSAWVRGGIYLASHNNGKLALVPDYYTTITYHAPAPGTLSIDFNRLASGSDSESIYGCSFAIFKNGEQIWPSSGGAFVYSSGSALPGSQIIDFLDQARAYEPFPTAIDVAEGDMIQFAMRRGESYMGYCEPVVRYLP